MSDQLLSVVAGAAAKKRGIVRTDVVTESVAHGVNWAIPNRRELRRSKYIARRMLRREMFSRISASRWYQFIFGLGIKLLLRVFIPPPWYDIAIACWWAADWLVDEIFENPELLEPKT